MKEVLVETHNPQPEIRKHVKLAKDWEYASETDYLYDKAVVFRERLLDPIARIDRVQLPDPIIGVENLRNYKVLAEYLLNRDAVGLSFRINFNEEHYIDEEGKKVWRFGRWAQLESLLHEYVHGWQQRFGDEPFKPGKSNSTHNKEFIEKCESLGLHPMPGVGCHVAVADEPFSILMKEWGIERPENVPSVNGGNVDWFKILIDLMGKGRKGTSSLTKWTCPECGLNARMGIKGNPEIVHDPCSIKKGEKVFFVRNDGLSHAIYKASKRTEQ
jgi:hypothetical protein